MGPLISGGAVVQHLSKLRIRMVAQNLPVPPPLKRGGGIKISTGPSLPRRPAKAPQPATARDATVKKSGKPVSKKRALADKVSDDSEEEDFKVDSDSDADYGKPLAKRNRAGATQRHQSPIKKSDDTDSDKDSSEDEAEHGEDGNGNRVVAAGADFLALEDDVPTKKTKVVTLKANMALIKQETPQEQESENDESDQSEDEVAGGSEDQATQAAHALEAISHISTPIANHASKPSGNDNADHLSGPHPYSTSASTMNDPEYGHPTSNGHSAFGGLTTAASLNTPTFQNAYEGMEFTDGLGDNAEGQQYHPMPHSDGQYMTYGPGYGHVSNPTFGIAPMSTNTAFSGNLPYHIVQSPYVDHSGPGLPRSYSRQGHQASLSAGANSLSSVGPSTVSQTPLNDEAGYFASSFDRNDHDHNLEIFDNEDLGTLGYGGYHYGA